MKASPLSIQGQNLRWTLPNSTTANQAPIPSTNDVGSSLYSVTQTVNGCESDQTTFTVTVNPRPDAPKVSEIALGYCQNSTAAVLLTQGQNLRWTLPNSTTTNQAPTPSTNNAGNFIYSVTQTNTLNCESLPTAISVTVNAKPDAPGVATPLDLCIGVGASPLSAQGQNLRWTLPNSTTTNQAPTPSTAITGVSSYSVTQTNSLGCESNPASLVVIVHDRPVPPQVTALPVVYCQGVGASSLSAQGQNLKWTLPNSTTTNQAPTPPTTDAGSSIYSVTQTDNFNCESNPAGITVTINAQPNAPQVAATSLNYCPESEATALSAQGQNLRWTLPNSTTTNQAPTPSTAITGVSSYSVTQTNTLSCVSLPTVITVTVNSRPDAPEITNPLNLCIGIGASPLAAQGQNLKWTLPNSTTTNQAPTPSTVSAGNSVYSVTQTNPATGCESNSASLTVIVNPKATGPVVSTPLTIYCQGVEASPLSAQGQNLKWTLPNSTTTNQVPTPSTSDPGSSLYSVTQTDSYGCESTKTTLTVTVNPRPDAPKVSATALGYCPGTTAAVLSAQGQNLRWTLPNSTTTTQAPIPSTNDVGSSLYSVTQINTLNCESLPTVITVTVNAKPDAPGVTNPINLCIGIGASPLSAQGQNLKWTLPNSTTTNQAPTPSTVSAGTSTYSVTQTVNGCESDKASITVTIKPLPTRPAVAATPVEYCLGATNAAPLSATATDASGSLRWYDANGNALSGPPTPPTTVAGTFSYSVSQLVNECEGLKAAVTFTIRPISPKPTGTATVVYCQNSTSASSLTATGQNLKWYDANKNVLAAAPKPSTDTPGTVTYFVTQTLANSCESDPAQIDVQITAAPDAPIAANVTYCQGIKATPLIATGTGTVKWYDANNNPLAGAPTPLTTANSSYYVTQIVNGCESKPTLVTVTVNALPAPPTPVATAVSLCQNITASPLTTTVPNAKWYDATYNPLAGAPTPLTTQPGTITYYVTQTDANSCESSKAPITVTIRPLPAAPVPAAARYCQNIAAQPLTATGTGTIKWYDANNNPLTGAPTPQTTSAGVINYYVSQTDANGCESSKAIVNVTVNPKPIAVASQTISYCQSAVPSSLTVIGQSLKWYQAATGGSAIAPPTPPTVSTTYYVSQTDATTGCESDRTAITVTVGAKPVVPITQAITYCENALPASLAVVGQNLKWYTTLTGGSATTTPAPPTVSTTYYVTQTDAVTGCESDRVQVPVTVKAKPRLPVTTPTTYCLGATASLTATATDGGQLNWYGTSQVGGAASSSPPTVSINTVVTTLFYVSQTVNGCESDRAIIAVTGSSKQVQPTTAPITLCQGSTAQPLSATATSGGVLNWYGTAATGGTASPNAPAPATGNLSTIPYYVSQTVNGCESDRAAIVVTVSAKPTAPTVTSSLTVCQGTTAPLSATASVGGILNWYVQPAGGPASQLAPTPSPSIDRYYVTQTVNGCESDRATIAVTVNPKPTVSLLSGDKTIYSSQSTVLTFSLTGTGPWTLGYSDSLVTTGTTSFSTAIATANSFTVSVAPTGTTIYKAVSISDKGCGIGTPSGTARITVSPLLGEPDPLVSEVKVYPVPTDGPVTVDIDLPLQKDPAQLQLINYTGTVIKQLTTKQHQTTIHLENHPSGPYLLYIKIGDRWTVRKIMKN